MLESLVQKYAPRRVISALLVAATISLSSSSYAKQPPIILAQASPPAYLHQDPDAESSLNLACSDYIDGRAKIGTTDYCVTKDARIYHRNGKELDDLHLNPDFVRLLMQTSDFKQALRQAQTGSAQAVVPTAPSPVLPETSPAEKKRGMPPPYLLPGGGPSSPDYSPSQSDLAPVYNPTPEPEQGQKKNTGNDIFGYLLTGIGLVDIGISVVVLTHKPSCEKQGTCYNPAEEEDKRYLTGWIITGAILSGIGIYLLSD